MFYIYQPFGLELKQQNSKRNLFQKAFWPTDSFFLQLNDYRIKRKQVVRRKTEELQMNIQNNKRLKTLFTLYSEVKLIWMFKPMFLTDWMYIWSLFTFSHLHAFNNSRISTTSLPIVFIISLAIFCFISSQPYKYDTWHSGFIKIHNI